MEHGLELIIPRLEIFGNWIFQFSHILETLQIFFFFLIAWYPGNIGNRFFLIQSYPGNIGNIGTFWGRRHGRRPLHKLSTALMAVNAPRHQVQRPR